jgi:hypothetical protein
MDSSINYLTQSTESCTPAEYEDNIAQKCVDFICPSHELPSTLKKVTAQRQPKITEFFPQLKKVQSYVRMPSKLATVKTYELDKIPYYFRL